jgi:hypothetical protein
LINEILNIEKSVGLVQVALKLNEVIRAQNAAESSQTSTNTASPKLPTFEELSSIIGIKNRLKDSNHQKCFIAGAHAMYTLIGGQLRA